MTQTAPTDPAAAVPAVAYTGIYNADGGLAGELRYIVGHLIGTAECALCDITHSPVRRKPEWDRMLVRLGVPFTVVHRNELDDVLQAAVRDIPLPVVLAHHADGSTRVAVSAGELARLGGSVAALERALTHGAPPAGA